MKAMKATHASLTLSALLAAGLAAGATPAMLDPPAEERPPSGPVAPPPLHSSPGSPLPDWLRQEMSLRAAGSGRWIADNRPHMSADEPADAYGIEWRWGVDQTSLAGRLFGLRDGKEIGEYWQYRVSWNPRTGQAALQQWGGRGAYGAGELRPAGPGRTDCVQVFHAPGAADWAVRHLSEFSKTPEATEVTRSFDWDGSGWAQRRTYVWKRAGG
jgi:hypothetical protein